MIIARAYVIARRAQRCAAQHRARRSIERDGRSIAQCVNWLQSASLNAEQPATFRCKHPPIRAARESRKCEFGSEILGFPRRHHGLPRVVPPQSREMHRIESVPCGLLSDERRFVARRHLDEACVELERSRFHFVECESTARHEQAPKEFIAAMSEQRKIFYRKFRHGDA